MNWDILTAVFIGTFAGWFAGFFIGRMRVKFLENLREVEKNFFLQQLEEQKNFEPH